VSEPAPARHATPVVADDLTQEVDDDSHGSGPHHDPSVHTEHEVYAVTTQRCRGEYP
jgi:hypothetical protein